MRKRCHRRPVTPQPPPGMRPRLSQGQLDQLSMAHVQNLDAIARGDAQASLLWDLTESALTWLHVAQAVGAGVQEMQQQCTLVESLTARWRRTGVLRFTGPELELARDGVVVMDQLAALATHQQALDACAWSEAQIAKVVAAAGQLQGAAA